MGADLAELVADRLFALGASAVSEQPGAHGQVVLVADVDPADLHDTAWEVRVLDDDPSVHTAWHSTATAWRCGTHFVVRPVWVDAPGALGADDVEVLVDPGAAFGAGSHATTRLALAALEPLAPHSARVLDVGSGTGVLGAAALLAGAGTLVAIDIDPGAVAATRRAIECNGLTGRARVGGDALAQTPGVFDLVLANLLLPVVEELGPELVAHVAPDGALVVSGVLEEQRARVLDAVAPMRVRSALRDGEWIALVLGR